MWFVLKKEIGFLSSILLWGCCWLAYCAEEIQIPTCKFATTALYYLSDRLGASLIYTDVGCQLNAFSCADTDVEILVKKFQEVNKDKIKIYFDRGSWTIFCSDIRISPFFEELLESVVEIGKDGNLYAGVSTIPMRLDINGHFAKEPKQNIGKFYLANWEKLFPKNPKLQELIFHMFDNEKRLVCHIPIAIPVTEQKNQKGQSVIAELKQIIMEGDATSIEDMERYAKLITLLDTPSVQKQDQISIVIDYSERKRLKRWDDPTFEEVAEELLLDKKHPFGKEPFDVGFFTAKFSTFESIEFLSVLLEKGVFNHDPQKSIVSGRQPPIFHVNEIPNYLVNSGNYDGINFLLKNLDRIESKEMQRYLTSCFGSKKLDRNRLGDDSINILMKYAKEFQLERIYADTSKWIGDDLPDGYDRWRDFKISETELVLEKDMNTVGKYLYRLKFFKYKEPVSIGGIPLKKMEEADYSTPEKAYFSCCSERTYEWSRASVYNNSEYFENHFDQYSQWKAWHSNVNPFAEILYKVEVSCSPFRSGIPNIFLVVKQILEKDKLVNVPMIYDEGRWKFFTKWPKIAEILDDYIQKQIVALTQNEKEGK
ncbi:MAG TPA: hypothetical protein PLN24_00005 [Victivallales bacterium]|nr:hypothetical protein [Victivallales bacterium]